MSVPPGMKNPNVSMKSIHDYKWGKQDIPTRENCDLEKPSEMFLWCFTAPPGLNGAPLVFPAEVFMMWSEHLYECGARLSGEAFIPWPPMSWKYSKYRDQPECWARANDLTAIHAKIVSS